MPAVLARLDALVAEHADARSGHRPPEQGEGDNFVVAFADAGAAVAFAADLQAALCGQSWPGDLSVSVRMAVHSGAAASRGTAIRFRHNDVESLAGECPPPTAKEA